jgi:hypothetical protein
VHGDGFTDDEAIANEFADRLAGIGIGDFVYFVRVQPDFALATANHGGSETLLRPEVDPVMSRWSAEFSIVGRTSRVGSISIPLVCAVQMMASASLLAKSTFTYILTES